jgi:hypothetical protein
MNLFNLQFAIHPEKDLLCLSKLHHLQNHHFHDILSFYFNFSFKLLIFLFYCPLRNVFSNDYDDNYVCPLLIYYSYYHFYLYFLDCLIPNLQVLDLYFVYFNGCLIQILSLDRLIGELQEIFLPLFTNAWFLLKLRHSQLMASFEIHLLKSFNFLKYLDH